VRLLDLFDPIRFALERELRKHMVQEMGVACMSQGPVTLAGSHLYTSMADTDHEADDALNKIETVLAACA